MYTFPLNAVLNEITLVNWNQLWWEYLHYENRQSLSTRACLPLGDVVDKLLPAHYHYAIHSNIFQSSLDIFHTSTGIVTAPEFTGYFWQSWGICQFKSIFLKLSEKPLSHLKDEGLGWGWITIQFIAFRAMLSNRLIPGASHLL